MNWFGTAVRDIRSGRKSFSITGSLLFAVLVLLASQSANCRPAEDETSLVEGLSLGDDYAEADNVEWHHVKIVDGVMREDHPVIMYKEDFVSEDFDPNKHQNGSRKYKDIGHRRRRQNHTNTEQYHALKPEKIYFDVLPQTPLDVVDDANDSKFDPSKIRVDVMPLTSDDLAGVDPEEQPTKQALSKHPKKYHRRARRDTRSTHGVHKRNSFYRLPGGVDNSLESLSRQYYGYPPLPPQSPLAYTKHAVPGKLWNGLSLPVLPPVETPMSVDNRFGGQNEGDRVVWNVMRQTTARPVTRRPTSLPSLFHDSDPNNADLSFVTSRPQAQIPNGSGSRPRPRPSAARPPATTTRSPATQSNETKGGISQCVWAIVNCCSTRNYAIRYNCFETNGCTGAFWDLNPCADNVKDNVISYISDYYD